MSSDDKKNKAKANDDVVHSATVVVEAEAQGTTTQNSSSSPLSQFVDLSFDQVKSNATTGDRAALNILNCRLSHYYIDKGQYFCEWLNRSPLISQKTSIRNDKEGPLELPCELLLRPHRFGKTFFLDVVQSIYEGRKELFTDTYLEKHWNWQQSPIQVIRIDFRDLIAGKGKTPFTYCGLDDPRLSMNWSYDLEKLKDYDKCANDDWINQSITNLCRVSQESFDASLLPSNNANTTKTNEFIDYLLTQLYNLFYQECTKSVNELEQEAFRKAMARATATYTKANGAFDAGSSARVSKASASHARAGSMDEEGVASFEDDSLDSFYFNGELSGTAHVDFSGHEENLMSCLSHASPRTALWQLSLLLKSCRPQSRVLLIDNLDAPLFDCLPHWEVYNYFSRFFNSFLAVIASCRSTFVRIVATSTIGFRQLNSHKRSTRTPLLPISLPFYGPSLGKICGFTVQEVVDTFASKIRSKQSHTNIKNDPKTYTFKPQIIGLMKDTCGGYYFGTTEEILNPTHVFDFFKDPLLSFQSTCFELAVPDWDYIKGVGYYNNLEFYALLSQIMQNRNNYVVLPRGKSSDIWYYTHNRSWSAKQAAIYGDDFSIYANKLTAFVDPLGKWKWTPETNSGIHSIFASLLNEESVNSIGTVNSDTEVEQSSVLDKAHNTSTATMAKAVADNGVGLAKHANSIHAHGVNDTSAQKQTQIASEQLASAQSAQASQAEIAKASVWANVSRIYKNENEGKPSPWPMEWAALPSRLVPFMPLFNRNHFESALALLELHGFHFKKQENLKYLYASLGLGGEPTFSILLGNILLANEFLQCIFNAPKDIPIDDLFKISKDIAEQLTQIRVAEYEADTIADEVFWAECDSFQHKYSFKNIHSRYNAIFRQQYLQCRKNDCFSNVLKELTRQQKEQIKKHFVHEVAHLGQKRFTQEPKASANVSKKNKAFIALNEITLDSDAELASNTVASTATHTDATMGEGKVLDENVILPKLHEVIAPITEGKAVTHTGQIVEVEIPTLTRDQLYEIVRINLNSLKRMKQTQETVSKASAAVATYKLEDRVQLGSQGVESVKEAENNEPNVGAMFEVMHRARVRLRSKKQARERDQALAVEGNIPAVTVISEDSVMAYAKIAQRAVKSGKARLTKIKWKESVLQAGKRVQQQIELASQAEKEKQAIHEDPDSVVIKSLKDISPEQFFVAMVSMATVTQEVLDAITHIVISVTNLQDMASVYGNNQFKWIFPRHKPDLSVPKTFYPLLELGLEFGGDGTANKATLVNDKDKDSAWFKMREELPPSSLWNSYTPLKVKRLLHALHEWQWRKLPQRERDSYFYGGTVKFNHLYSLRSTIGPNALARVMGGFDNFLMPNVIDNLAQAFYLAMGAKYQLCKLLNTYTMSSVEGYDNVHVYDLLQSLGLLNIQRISDGVCAVSIPNLKARTLIQRSLLNWCFRSPYGQYAMTFMKKELSDLSFFVGEFNCNRHVTLLDAIIKAYCWQSATQFSSAFICHILQFWLVLNVTPSWLLNKKLQVLVGSVEPPLPPNVARRYAMEKARSLGINLGCEHSIVEMYPEFYPQQHHCLAYIVNETESIIFEIVYIRSIEHSLPVTQYMRRKLLSVTNPLAAILCCHPNDPRVTKIKTVQRVVVTMCFLRDFVQVVSYDQLPKLSVHTTSNSDATTATSDATSS